MAPSQHIDWFEYGIAWFEDLDVDDLSAEVPNCPGWDVETVVNHLSFGLGVGYSVAIAKPPDTADEDAFNDVDWPESYPSGAGALATFTMNMRACLEAFKTVNPERSVYTYAGPGKAKFWFRRAAIETELHRMDVEDALRGHRATIPAEWVADGIAETVEFALPLAARLVGEPPAGLSISVPELALRLDVGDGPGGAEISGSGSAVLAALWGRDSDGIQVNGDTAVAGDWLSASGSRSLADSGPFSRERPFGVWSSTLF